MTTLRKVGIRLGGALLALLLLYLLLANALLQSGMTERRLSQALPGTHLEWSSAWSAFPGHLALEDLTLDSQGTQRRPLRLEAQEITAWLAPTALLRREWRLASVEATGIRHLKLGNITLEGSGRLSLDRASWRQGELSISAVDLTLDNATLRNADTTLGEDLRLEGRLSLDPLALSQRRGGEVLRSVSGRLDLAGQGDAAALLDRFLADQAWLGVQGRGAFEGRLEIEQGRLLPESEFSLTSTALTVTLDESSLSASDRRYRLRGQGELTARVTPMAQGAEQDAQTRLEIALDKLEMHRNDGEAALLQGEEFRLSLRAESPALYRAPVALDEASLTWTAMIVPDIARLSAYLPPDLPLSLQAGQARLQGELHYRGERLEGHFSLNGREVALRVGENDIQGALALELALPELDPQAQRIDASGSRVDIQAAHVGDDGEPFTLQLAFPQARLSAPSLWLPDSAEAETPPELEGQLRLEGQVSHLGFLDGFLAGLFGGRGLALAGGGRVDADLYLEAGRLRPQSRLSVASETIEARFEGIQATGTGRIDAEVLGNDPSPTLKADLDFNEVTVTRLDDARPLLRAGQLHLEARGDAPQLGMPLDEPRLSIGWQAARVPDVAVLNRYLPAQAPFRFQSGEARSQGRLTLAERRLAGHIGLDGPSIAGVLFDERVEGSLELELRVRDASLNGQHIDLSGSQLTLHANEAGDDDRLTTRLVARQVRLDGDLGWRESPDEQVRPLGGRLLFDASVENLGFLDAFLPDAHGIAVAGSGRLSADLHLAQGRLAPGSDLYVSSDRLQAHFLQYEAQGSGSLDIVMSGQEDAPRATLALTLPSFGVRRRDSAQAYLDGHMLRLRTQAQDIDSFDTLDGLETQLTLERVEAPDLSHFNAFLPTDSGLELLGGRARMSTHLRLIGRRARGEVSLEASDARIRLQDQTVNGDLSLDARLTEGDLDTLTFDISGSTLRLDNAELERSGTGDRHWWAHLALESGQLTWTQPLALDATLDLAMRDSSLLINLFVDAARERRWLRDRLTIRDVQGRARVIMDDHSVALRDAVIEGEGLELRGSLRFRDRQPQGHLFARYGALRVGIELEDGERNWRWWRPRQWYERQTLDTPSQGGPSDAPAPTSGWHDALEAQPRD